MFHVFWTDAQEYCCWNIWELQFLEETPVFSKRFAPIYIPTHKVSFPLHSSNTYHFFSFWSKPLVQNGISLWFWFAFPIKRQWTYFFMCLWLLYKFFGEELIQIFCQVFWSFFSVKFCKFLYAMVINPLWDVWYGKISYFDGFLSVFVYNFLWDESLDI